MSRSAKTALPSVPKVKPDSPAGRLCRKILVPPVNQIDYTWINELEKDVLAGLLRHAHADPHLAKDVTSLLPEDAVRTMYLSDLWLAMRGLCANNDEVNEVTLWNWLYAYYRQGKLGHEPQAWLIAELSNKFLRSAAEVRIQAQNLFNYRVRERMQLLFLELASDCVLDVEDPLDVAARAKFNLDQLLPKPEPATLAPLLDTVLNELGSPDSRPLPSPWPELNQILRGGLARGELTVLAGRPGLGKTALAGCWAVESARCHGPVLFVSCEVRDKTLAARLLSRESRHNHGKFREGGLSADDPTLQQARERLANLPLRIVDASTRPLHPGSIRRLARQLPGRPSLVVVDYLQLLYPDEPNHSREREIADMSRAMKRLAVELDCPVLLLSQLNRKAEESSRAPQLSDLRESGAIEQDADIVIMLHAERRHLAQQDQPCPIKTLVLKGRSSGIGEARLLFDKQHCDFGPAPSSFKFSARDSAYYDNL